MNYKGLRKERVTASPQFDGSQFVNPGKAGLQTISSRGFLPLTQHFLFGQEIRIPSSAIPVLNTREFLTQKPRTKLRVTWLGHSSTLLEFGPSKVLLDPVFGERASPVSFLGPKRFHPSPCKILDLLPLTAVIVSHDHYDHLCTETLLQIAKNKVPIVTSLGVGHHLEQLGIDPKLIHELDWNEISSFGGVSIRATPSQHFSGRLVLDRNKTLWSSWVVEGEGAKIFFSGDSGYSKDFADIGSKYGPFHLALVETGAFHPQWQSVHMGPQNAWKVFKDLKADFLLPVHWGTFCLALHDWFEPAETLFKLAQPQREMLLTPKVGEAIELFEDNQTVPWWRSLEDFSGPLKT